MISSRRAALLLAAALGAGCAGNQHADFGFLDGSKRSAGTGVLVRWVLDIAPPGTGNYIPVEQAAPGVDPIHDRLYVGSTAGVLWALSAAGKRLHHYDAGASIEAQPVVDPERNELYVSTVRGRVIALRSEDLSERYKIETGASISQAGLLSHDALYVVTDSDLVLALSRADGTVLWRYHREPREGFSIAGHAGLTMAGTKLLAAFGDGEVVALDAGDGKLLWSVDTSADIEELDSRHFVDVDTTPTVVGDVVYVASFSSGLFGLELSSGTVRARETVLKGVTAITAAQDALLVSSAERGVLCLDLPDLTLRWQRKVARGAPGRAEVHGDGVYVAESLGALLTLALADGREIGRLETGHGVTAPPVIEGRRGFMLSNAGRLYAFTY
ncbi:MAG: PQQ-binding-like beta-propeller repeat protein [Polyangiales bacterium]